MSRRTMPPRRSSKGGSVESTVSRRDRELSLLAEGLVYPAQDRRTLDPDDSEPPAESEKWDRGVQGFPARSENVVTRGAGLPRERSTPHDLVVAEPPRPAPKGEPRRVRARGVDSRRHRGRCHLSEGAGLPGEGSARARSGPCGDVPDEPRVGQAPMWVSDAIGRSFTRCPPVASPDLRSMHVSRETGIASIRRSRDGG